jgi:GT2 family glycosyltransferase
MSAFGTIGVCASDTARFSVFTESLAHIQTPPGSSIAFAYGSDIVNGRNLLVNELMRGAWIWMMDDDHAFAPDLLLNLLAHNVDVVVPVCLMRQQPFYPVERIGEDKALDLTTAAQKGLVEVHSAGTAGMLIRRSVLDRVRETFPGPIFEHGDVSEDYLFCARLRELGIPIHCDLGSRLGHATTTVIWPGEAGGEWCVDFHISDSFSIKVGITTA